MGVQHTVHVPDCRLWDTLLALGHFQDVPASYSLWPSESDLSRTAGLQRGLFLGVPGDPYPRDHPVAEGGRIAHELWMMPAQSDVITPHDLGTHLNISTEFWVRGSF